MSDTSKIEWTDVTWNPVRPEEIQKLLLTLSDIALASQGLLSGMDINPLVPTEDGRLMALDAALYFVSPAEPKPHW